MNTITVIEAPSDVQQTSSGNEETVICRRRVAHVVQIRAGLGKAADVILPLLSDQSRTHENAMVLARTVALYAFSYRSSSMTIDEAVEALMEVE